MNPTLTLNNGVEMPSLGFGVFQIPSEQTELAVETALATGYRLIDTAASYFNEQEVGAAIRRSGIQRSDVFIETKVWISDYGYDQTLHACETSTRKLGIDRLDLLIFTSRCRASSISPSTPTARSRRSSPTAVSGRSE